MTSYDPISCGFEFIILMGDDLSFEVGISTGLKLIYFFFIEICQIPPGFLFT